MEFNILAHNQHLLSVGTSENLSFAKKEQMLYNKEKRSQKGASGLLGTEKPP